MALREADPDVLALGVFVVPPPRLPGPRAGANADHVDGTVGGIVVGVAEEIFRGELPVGGQDPLVDADHLRPARPAVAAVQHLVQMIDGIAEIAQEIRRVRVPGCPDGALVLMQLWNLDQRPLGPVQLPSYSTRYSGTPCSLPSVV